MNLHQSGLFHSYSYPIGWCNQIQPLFQSFQQDQQRQQTFYFVNFFFPSPDFTNRPQSPGIYKERINQSSINLTEPRKQLSQNPRISEQSCIRSQKKNGNIKANIIRDFIRGIKKDGSYLLLAKQAINSQYPLKKFIETLTEYFPNENKYIRFRNVQNLCLKSKDPLFSELLRTVLLNFLRGDYKIVVLTKKKNKIQYLKACHCLSQRLENINKK